MMLAIFDSRTGLVTQAKQAKQRTPIWLVIILAFAFPMISQFGAVPFFMLSMMRLVNNPAALLEADIDQMMQLIWPQTALENMLILISSFAGIFLLVWLWVRFFEKRPFRSVGLPKAGWLLQFGRGFVVGAVIFAVAMLVMIMTGYYTINIGPANGVAAVGTVLLILVGWLVQGPAEELLFRGWILPAIGAQSKVWIGIVLSSVLFAILHALNPNISLLAFVNLFLFGFFAALYALVENSLWGVFGVHAVWNWVQGNIFGLEVSGIRQPSSILELQENGPDVVTGGAFGPEGGLMITLTLVIAIGIVLWLGRNKTRASAESEGLT